MAEPNGPVASAFGADDLIWSTVSSVQASPAIPKLLQVGGDGGVDHRSLHATHNFLPRVLGVGLKSPDSSA